MGSGRRQVKRERGPYLEVPSCARHWVEELLLKAQRRPAVGHGDEPKGDALAAHLCRGGSGTGLEPVGRGPALGLDRRAAGPLEEKIIHGPAKLDKRRDQRFAHVTWGLGGPGQGAGRKETFPHAADCQR